MAVRNEGIALISYDTADSVEVLYTERFVSTADNFYSPDFLREHRAYFTDLLNKLGLDNKKDIIVIEGPSMASNNFQFSIGAAFGFYSLYLGDKGYEFYILPPTKWQKIIVDNGRATKSQIKSCVLHIFPQLVGKKLSQDELDALGMAYTMAISFDVLRGLSPILPQFNAGLTKDQRKCILDQEKGILYNKLLHHC